MADNRPMPAYGNAFRDELTSRFQRRYGAAASKHVRLAGVLFARPSSPLAHAEVLPALGDYFYCEGKLVDFYFAGYVDLDRPYRPDDGGMPVPGKKNWMFVPRHFDLVRTELQAHTRWVFSGGCDLLLANARYDEKRNKADFDFTSIIMCQLDNMKRDGAIVSVEQFFQAIFNHVESCDAHDPTWGLSDAQGLHIAGSVLQKLVLLLVPKDIREGYMKAKHFAVRDVSLKT